MPSLRDLIDRQLQFVADLERQLETARVKLSAFQEALAAVEGGAPEPGDIRQPRQPREAGERRMSMAWERIFSALRDLGQTEFTTDDALQAASIAGIETNRNAVRSNLANYVKAGVIERVTNGNFRFAARPESA